MRVDLSARAREVWKRLTGAELDLEEVLRDAAPEGVEEIRALGYRRSVGVVRRVDQLWVLVKGDEEAARRLEDRLVDTLAELAGGEKRLLWAGRAFLRVTPVGGFERPEVVRSRLERRCLAWTAGSVALALAEAAWWPLSPAVYAGIAAVSVLTGYLLPWRTGSFELIRECLKEPGRLPALTAVTVAAMTFAGLGGAFVASRLGAGLLGVVLVACATGLAAVRFLDHVNLELVKAREKKEREP